MTRTKWNDSAFAAYSMGAILALALVAWLFPLSFILGKGFFFEFGDVAQHVSGWLLYAADEWRWPLLLTQRIAPPEGLPIFMTDSIPLAALIFKPFAGLLPEGFHYFGLWQLVSKLGQALAAVYLIRGFGLRKLHHAAFAAAFALVWPVYLERLGHAALGTHALILLALAVYVRARFLRWSDAHAFLGFTLIGALALLTHPYLLAMVVAVEGAFTLDRLWSGPRRWSALLALAASAVFLGVLLWPLGYLSESQAEIGGFELYSMNLASPVCGGSLSPCNRMDATGGQNEGFNNLGLGLLVLIPVALWCGRRLLLPALTRAPGVLLVMAGLVLYALSNRIWLGPHVLLEYSLPEAFLPITKIFRAPGRFFWPVGYLILFVTLAVLLRTLRMRVAAPLLACALVLQAADSRAILEAIDKHADAPAVYDFSAWNTALDGIQHIEVFPRYGCVLGQDEPYVFLQLLAGKLQTTISTAYQPRPDQNCSADFTRELPALTDETLLVSLAGDMKLPEPSVVEQAIAKDQCRRLILPHANLLACTTNQQTRWDLIGFPAKRVR